MNKRVEDVNVIPSMHERLKLTVFYYVTKLVKSQTDVTKDHHTNTQYNYTIKQDSFLIDYYTFLYIYITGKSVILDEY